MSWNDKPTEKQLATLNREFGTVLYGAMLNAQDRGAYKAHDVIDEMLDTDLIKNALARTIRTRRQASEEIEKSIKCLGYVSAGVQQAINEYLKPYGVDAEVFYDRE